MVNNVEKVKEKIDIVDLISGYLKLKKSGVNYKANCPFHNEKTPSFIVSVERQVWHCFGCSRGGDHFSFVQEMEGADFPEALRILAKRAGIELDQFDRSFQNAKTKLLAISELAAKFFQKQLWESNAGQKALVYLKDRGVNEETARTYQLGFAPDSWQGLIDFMKNCSWSEQEISDAGLSVRRESGSGHYDRFRSRIMFPVLDFNGQTVGFTGRIFGKENGAAKYVNTPQTMIYDKSKILYGLDKAKMSIKSEDKCLIMEGNMDVILSHQAGVLNAVASSGTALTEQHLKTIRRYTNNLDLCFDQDSAGRRATDRGISLALQQDFNLGVVIIDDPACKDPADYVQKYGEKWRTKAKEGHSIFDFYIESACRQFDPVSASGKKAIAQKILPLIKQVVSPVERSHWLGELVLRLRTKEETLVQEMEAMAEINLTAVNAPSVETKKLATLATPVLLEDYLIALLLVKPDLVSGLNGQETQFYSPKINALFKIIRGHLSAEAVDFNQLGGGHSVADLFKTASLAIGAEEMYLDKLYLWGQERWAKSMENAVELQSEFAFIGSQLRRKNIVARLAELEMAIKQAEKRKDKKTVVSLAGEFQNTASFLNK